MKMFASSHSRRGNILAALLFTLLCGALCLILLTHTLNHHRIMGIRYTRGRALAALEDNLNLEIHHLFSLLNQADLDSVDNPETELFSRNVFPNRIRDCCQITHDFHFQRSTTGGMETFRALDHIRASQLQGPYALEADVCAKLLSGSIPINSIPLFLTANLPTDTAARDWLNTKGIIVAPGMIPRIAPRNPALDVRSLTKRMLDLGDLELSWAEIRARLGLPVSDMPLPEGIYLIRSPARIHAVLVQGNLDHLTFSGHTGFQRLEFTLKGQTFRMEYEPAGTIVDCWIPDSLSNMSYSECIVINGDCRDINTESDSGEIIPAFHPDSRILLLVSGEVVINSSLEKEMLGVKQIQPPGISIVCAKSNVLHSGGDGIRLECGDRAALNAAFITNGKIIHGKGDLRITGSICAAGLENAGKIVLTPSVSRHPLMGTLNLYDLKILTGIQMLRLEEVYPDEE